MDMEKYNEFINKILDLTEEYKAHLPSHEIGVRMIAMATNMLLYCAPSETIGMKTIMAAVGIGINEYEEEN